VGGELEEERTPLCPRIKKRGSYFPFKKRGGQSSEDKNEGKERAWERGDRQAEKRGENRSPPIYHLSRTKRIYYPHVGEKKKKKGKRGKSKCNERSFYKYASPESLGEKGKGHLLHRKWGGLKPRRRVQIAGGGKKKCVMNGWGDEGYLPRVRTGSRKGKRGRENVRSRGGGARIHSAHHNIYKDPRGGGESL